MREYKGAGVQGCRCAGVKLVEFVGLICFSDALVQVSRYYSSPQALAGARGETGQRRRAGWGVRLKKIAKNKYTMFNKFVCNASVF